MHVIRRGLLALVLMAPLVLTASVTSAPASSAAACNGSGANVGGNVIGTFVCLTIDAAPAKAAPLKTSSGAPLVCWLEPQYTPAQLKTLIEYDASLPESVVGEGGVLYGDWKTYYSHLTPGYKVGEKGWWWGVGCDDSNVNASTYEEQLWSDVGLDVYHPWEWVPARNIPPAPPGQVTTAPMLAEYAKEAATLDEPSGVMSPMYTNGGSTQTVGLPTYFWGQIGNGNAPVTQHTIIAQVQWLKSTVVATPVSVTITTSGATKGPSTITCPVTAGKFGTPDPDNTTIDSDCSFTYTEPSNGVTVTMTTNWKVDWLQANGAAGWPADETSQTVTFGGIKVQEVQTINNG